VLSGLIRRINPELETVNISSIEEISQLEVSSPLSKKRD